MPRSTGRGSVMPTPAAEMLNTMHRQPSLAVTPGGRAWQALEDAVPRSRPGLDPLHGRRELFVVGLHDDLVASTGGQDQNNDRPEQAGGWLRRQGGSLEHQVALPLVPQIAEKELPQDGPFGRSGGQADLVKLQAVKLAVRVRPSVGDDTIQDDRGGRPFLSGSVKLTVHTSLWRHRSNSSGKTTPIPPMVK